MPLFKNVSFLLLALGEAIAGITIWVCTLINLQFLSQLLDSNLATGLTLMSGMLASVIFLPITGKMIDRYDKQKILLYSTLMRTTAPIFMLFAISNQSLIWLILSLMVNQIAGSMYLPTVRSAMPALVGQSNLLSANTFYMNVATVARIAGTSIGGILLTFFSLYHVTIGTLIGFILLLLIVICVKIPISEAQARRSKEKLKFTEVFEIMKQEPTIVVGLITTGIIMLFLGGFNLLVLSFGKIQNSTEIMGYIYSVEGISVLVAGLFVKKLVGTVNLIKASTLLLLAVGLGEIGLSFATSQTIVLLSYVLLGLTFGFIFPMVTTIFQKKLPETVQGRFFSFKELVDRILIQGGMLITSLMLDLIGLTQYIIILGGATLLVGVLAFAYTQKHNLVTHSKDQQAFSQS
ncbi:MFS transporter [Brevibacillus daliensis]|uniref:MFS transporter n=1 Tax=Brevibacillus daliensis TaxID=2892995 RepID=UPI001E3FB66A|nr:MFS transporter [Brevibacillus daliensis]